MHILLININPVVSRLISLCMREENIDLEEVQNAGDVSRDSYDMVFVDESSYIDETQEVLANLMMRKKVFLSTSDEINDEVKLFDNIIKKPFLPSQITEILKSLKEDESLETATEVFSFSPFSSDEESQESIEEKVGAIVLDSNEIEKIKALLEMEEEMEEEVEEVNDEELESRKVELIKQKLIADGLEIVDEDEYVEALSKKAHKQNDSPAETRTKKSKKAQKVKNKKIKNKKTFSFEEALLEAVKGMKVKKIKKLLKGAEVTIKINFKEKNR